MGSKHSMRRLPLGRAVAAGAAACGLVAAGIIPSTRPAEGARGRGPAFVPGEVLVHFKDGVSDVAKAHVFGRSAVRFQERIETDAMRAAGIPGIHRVFTPGAVQDAIRSLAANPDVDYAEPNWVYTHQAVSNDAYVSGGYLWGMYGPTTTPGSQFGSNASQAWASGFTGSNSVYVGIIDQGIQFTHPELAANIWTNPWEAADGVDNDGNGYADDVHGWDFYNNTNQIYSAADGDDHGTHVAGTIGGVGGNGVGVAGVNWNVSMLSAKFIGPNGGSTADAVKALDYFTNMKVKHGLNLVALNNSWGGGGYSQALHDAIIRAAKQNILFVAAAGNNSSDNDAFANYPSNYDTSIGTSTESAAGYNSVIAVAAIGSDGSLASFSDWGATKVHLGAPGVGIVSTIPTDNYGSYSGTSMATPHVTGAAALYASTHPGVSAAQIRSAILSSAAPTVSLSGRTTTGGRLDVGALMTGSASTPPPPPASLPAPVVSSVNPYWMYSGTSVKVSVSGQYFQAGARVAFTGNSSTLPQVSGVSVSADGRTLYATFSCARIKGVKKNQWWNVKVTNPDNQAGQANSAFCVIP